jgi:hypothetical protein
MDPAFDMPARNWGQQGSFQKPVAPPIDGPADGTLVQLPCINRDWLPLLMGAVDQLQNPSTWLESLSDAARDLVLSRVTQLQEMLWSNPEVLCVPPVEYRFTSDCLLQTSSDSGATWVTVPGFDTYFDACVKAHVPPAVPVPVNPGHPTDNACAIAGWLTYNIFQINEQKLHDALMAGQAVDQYIREAVQTIVAFAPILDFIVGPFEAFYNTALPQPLAELQAAASDSGFQLLVQCAIYSAIQGVGYVDSTNFAQVGTNLAGIAYTHPWVPVLLANLWTNLGLTAWRTIQAEGSLTAADCSSCGAWCIGYTASALSTYWAAACGAPCGNFAAGAWNSVPRGDLGLAFLRIITSGFPSGQTLTQVDIRITASNDDTDPTYVRAIYLLDVGFGILRTISLPHGIWGSDTKLSFAFPPTSGVRYVQIDWPADNVLSTTTIDGVNLYGQGTNPAPTFPCTF